jgi:hypothetical protein
MFFYRSYISGSDVRIEKDPDMTKLAQEARRLSMGQNSPVDDRMGGVGRRMSQTPAAAAASTGSNRSNGSSLPRRPSEGFGSRSPRLSEDRRQSSSNGYGNRRQSETPPKTLFSRKTSESLGLNREPVGRRASSDLSEDEIQQRRLSEAGMRRPSCSEQVLNEDTSKLMVGLPIWVDGTKPGRIAYIGEVHFAKGDMAGVHLDRAEGKNNGTVGGVLYFQCEPRRGIFSRLYRLTREPVFEE